MDQDFPSLLFFPSAYQNPFPFLFAFHHPPLLYDPRSPPFAVLYHVLFLPYAKKFLSAYRAFQRYYFSCEQAAAWEDWKGQQNVPTSHFLAQYFSPNSSLGEFTGGSEVEYAMWRCRGEGSTSGRVSKETARKRNFSYCHSSSYPVEDAPAPSLSATPLKQQKKEHLAIREVA